MMNYKGHTIRKNPYSLDNPQSLTRSNKWSVDSKCRKNLQNSQRRVAPLEHEDVS
jgi:hypothetical protein